MSVGIFSATSLSGNLTGNVSGNVSGNISFLFMNELNQITQIILTGNTPTILLGVTGQTFDISGVSYSVEKRIDGSPYYHGMNTFFMTAKFFDANDGQILDFVNSGHTTSYNITEEKDMYYQIDFDNFDRTYQIYKYTGITKLDRIGTGNTTNNSILFYEKGGAIIPSTPTPTPTPIGGVTTTPIPTSTPYPTSTPAPSITTEPTWTPTPEPTLTPTSTPT
jgi:hypothetical protein